MKYFIDRKNNIEKVYAMDFMCEGCLHDCGDSSELTPEECSAECERYYRGCLSYKEIYTGKIGMSFLEFISSDFDEIIEDLIALWYKAKDFDSDMQKEIINDYFDGMSFYFKLLGVDEAFSICSRGNVMFGYEPATPENYIPAIFDECIQLQEIVSAYADDKCFVEPDILLKALNKWEFFFLPSYYEPEIYGNFKADPVAAIKQFEAEYKMAVTGTLEFCDVIRMFGIPFEWIVKNGYRISRCENCGKFFVPYGKYNARFCEYPFKKGKSCRELSFAINVENNAVLREYRKIYKTKHAWMNRNKDNHANARSDFNKWHKNAKAMVDRYKSGAVSEKECLNWLDENK